MCKYRIILQGIVLRTKERYFEIPHWREFLPALLFSWFWFQRKSYAMHHVLNLWPNGSRHNIEPPGRQAKLVPSYCLQIFYVTSPKRMRKLFWARASRKNTLLCGIWKNGTVKQKPQAHMSFGSSEVQNSCYLPLCIFLGLLNHYSWICTKKDFNSLWTQVEWILGFDL